MGIIQVRRGMIAHALHVHVMHIRAVVAFVTGALLEELAGQHFVRPFATVLVLLALTPVVVVGLLALSLHAAIGLSVVLRLLLRLGTSSVLLLRWWQEWVWRKSRRRRREVTKSKALHDRL